MLKSQHLLNERYFTTIGYQGILTLMLIINSGKLTMGRGNEDLLCLYIKNVIRAICVIPSHFMFD